MQVRLDTALIDHQTEERENGAASNTAGEGITVAHGSTVQV